MFVNHDGPLVTLTMILTSALPELNGNILTFQNALMHACQHANMTTHARSHAERCITHINFLRYSSTDSSSHKPNQPKKEQFMGGMPSPSTNGRFITGVLTFSKHIQGGKWNESKHHAMCGQTPIKNTGYQR